MWRTEKIRVDDVQQVEALKEVTLCAGRRCITMSVDGALQMQPKPSSKEGHCQSCEKGRYGASLESHHMLSALKLVQERCAAVTMSLHLHHPPEASRNELQSAGWVLLSLKSHLQLQLWLQFRFQVFPVFLQTHRETNGRCG